MLLGFSSLLLAEADREHLSSVIDALRVSDPAKEQNLFCRGGCHLAKASHRMTSVDIESSGARTLLEVLANAPGIIVKKDHFGRPTLGLYGMLGMNRIDILIDGQRVNDPFDGATILSLPAPFIDFVDVYYGPGGTWFGEGSLLGVISVFTKQAEIKQFGQFSYDQSIGGGIMATAKYNRIRSGAFASFGVQNPRRVDHQNLDRFTSEPANFSLQNISASGFFEIKISNTAQAFLLGRSAFSRDFFGPTHDYGFGKLRHRKLLWVNDLHLIKKRAQKNAIDLFFSFGVFRGEDRLFVGKEVSTFQHVDDIHRGLRFEVGTKFHTKPFHGHDLFFGFGGILQGVRGAEHQFATEAGGMSSSSAAMRFPTSPQIFGRPSALFVATTGHGYGFIQDEWRIRAPLLFTVGSRLILPIESTQFSVELLPNVAVVLIPVSKLRFTTAFQTSMRVPTIFEQSDRLQDSLLYNNSEQGYSPVALDVEKSQTIESSVWYGDVLGDTQLKTSFSIYLAKIDDAISTTKKRAHDNQNEIHIAGFRSLNEAIFHGGHSFSLGAFYSMAFRKEFDAKGYSLCQAGFIKGFSVRRYCPFEDGVPRFMLKANVTFDMASAGGLNLSSSFVGQSTVEDLFTEPQIVFESTYTSKPIWRYMTIFTSLRSSFFGYHYRMTAPDMATRTRNFKPAILLLGGWSINL